MGLVGLIGLWGLCRAWLGFVGGGGGLQEGCSGSAWADGVRFLGFPFAELKNTSSAPGLHGELAVWAGLRRVTHGCGAKRCRELHASSTIWLRPRHKNPSLALIRKKTLLFFGGFLCQCSSF